MNHIIKPMTAAVLIGALAACASKPPAGTPAYDAYMAEQAREAAIEQVDNTLKASPIGTAHRRSGQVIWLPQVLTDPQTCSLRWIRRF